MDKLKTFTGLPEYLLFFSLFGCDNSHDFWESVNVKELIMLCWLFADWFSRPFLLVSYLFFF